MNNSKEEDNNNYLLNQTIENKEKIAKNKSNIILNFNENNDIDKNFTSENNSCLSLIKIMEENQKKQKFKKFKSSSCGPNKNINQNISVENEKRHKKKRNSANKLSNKVNINNLNKINYSNNKVIPYDENENTKIITKVHVRKLSISSDNSIINNNLQNKNKNKDINYSGTRIDYVLNLKINNNNEKMINEIKFLSEKYIYKNGEKKKELKDHINKNTNNNIAYNNNQYQHLNFLNCVCLDSIEELYEEENDSKTRSKINSHKTNKTNSELNSLLLSEKKINQANSWNNANKYNKISNSNTYISNIKNNLVNNTTCLSSKYNLGKNNIFDISSDEEELDVQKTNNINQDINYIDNDNNKGFNFDEDKNNYHNLDSNILIRPLDNCINYSEFENTNSFMNDSDINKLFSSPNKKIISFIDNTTSMNNNNNMVYTKKINNSAINKTINRHILNDENDFNFNNNSINNIFLIDKKEVNNKQYYNKTYIKKSISKDKFSNSKLDLKNLISPENLNKYYSSSFINTIHINNNKKNIKIFYNNNITCKRLLKNNIYELSDNDSIKNINTIKNKKYIKYFIVQNLYVNKIKLEPDIDCIEEIENKRIYINSNSKILNSDVLFKSMSKENTYKNGKDEYIDNTLSTTVEKKNNTINNYYNSFSNKNNIEDNILKELIINDSKNKNKSNKIYKNKNSNSNKDINKKVLNLKFREIPHVNPFKLDDNVHNNTINYINKKGQNIKKNNNVNTPETKINKYELKKKSHNSSDYKNNEQNISFSSLEEDELLINIQKTSINNKSNNNDFLKNTSIKDNSKKNNNKKLYISIKSYEDLIQELISHTDNLKNNIDNKNYNNLNIIKSFIFKDNIMENNNIEEINNYLLTFEQNVQLLKNQYLCLLVKKHFLKNKFEKIKLIKDINIKNKRELFKNSYSNLIKNIQERLKYDNNDIKIFYFNKIINILERYKNITKYDIKYTKKIYVEENELSPYNLDIKTDSKNQTKINNIFGGLFVNDSKIKKIITSTTIILPILYGINYLMSLYNEKQK